MTATQPRAPRYDVDEIHRRLPPLVDVIGSRWGVQTTPPRGHGTTQVECPMHRPGHTSSASVSEYNGRQYFKCWRGCSDKAVDLIRLLELVDGLSTGDAIAEAARIAGVDPTDPTDRTGPRRPKPKPAEPRPLREPEPLDHEPTIVRTGRATAFLETWCRRRGWPYWIPEVAGLAPCRIYGRARVLFEHAGGWYWQARATWDTDADGLTGADRARWIAAKGSTPTLAGVDHLDRVDTIPSWWPIWVTEGPSDRCALLADGFAPGHGPAQIVLACPGVKAWDADRWGPMIARSAGTRPVFVAGDNDEAGHRFARDVTAGLRGLGVRAAGITPPVEGDDLDGWRRRLHAAKHPPGRFAADLFDTAERALDETEGARP